MATSSSDTARRRARREQWKLENGPCVDCGSWEELEVDHVDPSTKHPSLTGPRGSRRSIWSFGDEDRAKELAKCVARCRPCHLEKTKRERRPNGPQHGTYNEYNNHGCRCRPCSRANTIYHRAKRERRRALSDQG